MEPGPGWTFQPRPAFLKYMILSTQDLSNSGAVTALLWALENETIFMNDINLANYA